MTLSSARNCSPRRTAATALLALSFATRLYLSTWNVIPKRIRRQYLPKELSRPKLARHSSSDLTAAEFQTLSSLPIREAGQERQSSRMNSSASSPIRAVRWTRPWSPAGAGGRGLSRQGMRSPTGFIARDTARASSRRWPRCKPAAPCGGAPRSGHRLRQGDLTKAFSAAAEASGRVRACA